MKTHSFGEYWDVAGNSTLELLRLIQYGDLGIGDVAMDWSG